MSLQGDNSSLKTTPSRDLFTFLKHEEKFGEFRVSMWLSLIFHSTVVIIMVALFSPALPKHMKFDLSLKQSVVDETLECP